MRGVFAEHDGIIALVATAASGSGGLLEPGAGARVVHMSPGEGCVGGLFEQVPFLRPERAQAILSGLLERTPEATFRQIEALLVQAPDPDEVVLRLDAFARAQPASFARLQEHPAGLRMLLAVLGYSRFLSEELLQHPEWLEERLDSPYLFRVFRFDQYQERLGKLFSHSAGVPTAADLAEFRRRMLLRILLRDVLGYATLAEITEELSNLADAILDFTYRRVYLELAGRFGIPQYLGADGTPRECGFAVIALGKLGGRELNYSSDIDLMFLYSGPGETAGPEHITNKEFFNRLATQLTALLHEYTPKGQCYRVDLRLRPDGSLGELCQGLEAACEYYRRRARDWELQMLLKARAAAGSLALGQKFLQLVEPLIYSTTLDFRAVESMSETRDRIAEKQARRKGKQEVNIKLMPGGIRDIEFLAQCLQRLHGGRDRWVRHGGTMQALARLHDKDFLSDAEYGTLSSAYQFLRCVEHRLQFYDDRQVHTLPSDAEKLAVLARRIPALALKGAPTAERLLGELRRHTENVREIYERVIYAQQPIYYGMGIFSEEAPEERASEPKPVAHLPEQQPANSSPGPEVASESNIIRYLDQIAPRLAVELRRHRFKYGSLGFERFLEGIASQGEWMTALDGDPVLAGYVVDIFEHSPYFSEQLNRTPELIEELISLRRSGGPAPDYREIAEHSPDPTELRKSYRRAMFRIQSESICLRTPIFQTLARTSDLADAAIVASYRMAVEQVSRAEGRSRPSGEMMVIALGRLGMREFDLGSDADLVFVVEDSLDEDRGFWQKAARRMIEILSSYTGHGILFAVDTRLRPYGNSGDLVQTVSGVKDYFSRSAEAWEGITYMKSRAVAGDLERGTTFLSELQDVDWRRYGQSGRSVRDLRQMRLRIQKEHGASNPIKSGFGGYYDIDFALMYLRLKAAGIFFKVLNTEQRIDILERMGHLDRNDANFLRDAATFYRAVDHGMRLISGHTSGSLPSSGMQLELLTELVSRWTPDYLHDQPLDREMEQIQMRTREFFDRLFAVSVS